MELKDVRKALYIALESLEEYEQGLSSAQIEWLAEWIHKSFVKKSRLVNLQKELRLKYRARYTAKTQEAKQKIALLIEILEDNEGSYGLYSLADKQTIRSIKHYLKHDGKRI